MHVTKDTCDQLLHARMGPSDSDAVGEAPLKLEKVDEVLWGHGQEAAVGVGGRARVSRVLPEEDAAVPAEVQRVPVLLPGRVALLQGEVCPFPLDVAAF